MSAHPGAQGGVAGQVGQRAREHDVARRRAARRRRRPRSRRPRCPRRDDRQPGGARLERRDAERLEPRRRSGRRRPTACRSRSSSPVTRPGSSTQSSHPWSAGSAPCAPLSGPRRRSSRAAARRGRGPRAHPRSTASSGSGRLRETRRIADTTCTGCRTGSRVARRPAGRHALDVDAVGHHRHRRRRRRPRTRPQRLGRHVDTALRATPRAAQRARCPTARNTGASRAMTQWKVMAVGQARAEGDRHAVGGERADHAEVRVGDVEAAAASRGAPHAGRTG